MAADGNEKASEAGQDRPPRRARPPTQRRRASPRLLVPLLFIPLFSWLDVVRFSRHSGDHSLGSSVREEWAAAGSSTPDCKVKSLVVTQLPPVKSEHYNLYLGPSWRKLVDDRREEAYDASSEAVQADLFVACTEQSCDQIDRENCVPLNVTGDATADSQRWKRMLERRSLGQLLCYFAPVPEKRREPYKFAHSLNFLEMEPFVSLMKLGYYDYVLRTDADAVLFPGLLRVRPAGSGLVGRGYYGENVTDRLVRHFAKELMPELGEPHREAHGPGATPSMQSTFYVRADLVPKFASTLLNATRALYEKAFDLGLCKQLERLEFVQEYKRSYHMAEGKYPPVGPKKTWLCMWPFWHKGVSSLYGTRMAVDYVLENVTVTNALDALSTHLSFEDRPVRDVVQSHVLGLKSSVKELFGAQHRVVREPGRPSVPDGILCVAPNETVRTLRSKFLAKGEPAPGDLMLGILDAMETVAYGAHPAPATMYHQIAEFVLRYYREQKGCPWTFREGGFEVLDEGGAKIAVSRESYKWTLREIAWAREQSSSMGKLLAEGEEEEKSLLARLRSHRMNLERLESRAPEMAGLLRRWCGRCAWNKGVTTCNKRRDFLVKKYKLSTIEAMTAVMEQEPLCVLRRKVTNWCGNCTWETTTCDKRKEFLMNTYELTPAEALSFAAELEPACSGGVVAKSKWCGDCSWRGGIGCDKRKDFLMKKYNLNKTHVEETLMEQGYCAGKKER
ncbi:hypothetical protein ACHAWF_005886 [Thalassiosira exigua]